MLRVQLVAPKTFEIEECRTPEPKKGEVLIRVSYVALCGSEFPSYLGIATQHPLYERHLNYPRALGHEASGIVEAVGPGVTDIEVGQRVVPRKAHYGTHAICEADTLTPIPDDVTEKQAALTLMTQETYYVCRELVGIQPQDRILIIGMGPFGMLCLEQVREIGCTATVVADLIPERLTWARELGATHVLNAGNQDLVEAVPGLLGQAPSVVVETSGQPKPLKQAFKALAPEGRVALAGRPYKRLEHFEIEDLFDRMLTVYGAKTPPAGYDPRYTAIALNQIRENKIHADRLITHEFPLHRIGEAFELATNPGQGGLKIVINCAIP